MSMTMTTPILEQCDKLEGILRDDHHTQVVTGPAARNYTKALRQLEALVTLIKKHERRLRDHDAVEQWITTAFRVSASLPMGRTTIAQNDALNARCAWLALTLRRVHFALGHYASVPEAGRVECLRGELHRMYQRIREMQTEGMLIEGMKDAKTGTPSVGVIGKEGIVHPITFGQGTVIYEGGGNFNDLMAIRPEAKNG